MMRRTRPLRRNNQPLREELERISPDAHFFVRSRHPWVTLPEGVPAFETLPGEGEGAMTPAQQARVAAAMAG